MTCGFSALAAAAEAELKRTNSCELQRASSCSSLGAGSNLSSSTVHTVLLSFGAGLPNANGEAGSHDSSTSDISSTPSVAEEAEASHAKLASNAAADHNLRLAALVAADQRIFGGEKIDKSEAARLDASQVA